MFVVNFDFTDHILPLKLLAINIPVIVIEVLAYPLQRLQTLLISQPSYITGTQLNQTKLILQNMVRVEGFPKMLHGMRYSVDYMGTQMTTKFLLFDLLMDKFGQMDSEGNNGTWKIMAYCFIANAASTIVSQIAFNYQTIGSSLPIDKSNRPENVRIMLQNYTKKNRIPINGLKYTLPVSIINTGIELFLLNQTANLFSRSPNMSYLLTDLLTALLVFSTTSFTLHYAFQRQVQICKGLKQRSIPYTRGLLGSFIRYNVKGMALFALYMGYFQLRTKQEIEGMYQKRKMPDNPQNYRK